MVIKLIIICLSVAIYSLSVFIVRGRIFKINKNKPFDKFDIFYCCTPIMNTLLATVFILSVIYRSIYFKVRNFWRWFTRRYQ